MDGPAGGGYKYQQLPPIYTETDQSAIENRDRTNYAQGQSHVVIPVLGGNNDSNGYGTLIGNVQEGGGIVYKKYVIQTDMDIRKAFIRKVYTILMVQLGLTSVIAGTIMLNRTMQQWVLGHIVGVLVTSVIGTLVTMLWLWFKSKSYPQNMILLGLFTIFEAMMIGTLLAEYSNSGNGILVLKALLITLGVVIGLTVFTMQSKYDFSGLGPILTVALFGFTGFMLVNMFIPFSAGGGMFEYGITIFGVGLFSLYLVYDTYMIMNKLEVDEYILGSLMLYLDIINIFLNILRLISEAQDH